MMGFASAPRPWIGFLAVIAASGVLAGQGAGLAELFSAQRIEDFVMWEGTIASPVSSRYVASENRTVLALACLPRDPGQPAGALQAGALAVIEGRNLGPAPTEIAVVVGEWVGDREPAACKDLTFVADGEPICTSAILSRTGIARIQPRASQDAVDEMFMGPEAVGRTYEEGATLTAAVLATAEFQRLAAASRVEYRYCGKTGKLRRANIQDFQILLREIAERTAPQSGDEAPKPGAAR